MNPTNDEVNLIFEIFKIVLQILITAGLGFYISKKLTSYKSSLDTDLGSYKLSLDRVLEDYKKEISKELFQFQTKYSLFHQQEADAIAKLFEILVDLGYIVDDVYHTFSDEIRFNTTNDAQVKFAEFIDTYQKKRIYLDDEICKDIEEIKNLVSKMIKGYIQSNNFRLDRGEFNTGDPEIDKQLEETRDGIKEKNFNNENEIYEKFQEKFPELKEKLRKKFRKLLTDENQESIN